MNKKGDILSIIVWIIIVFVAVLFFATWIYGHDLLTQRLRAQEISTNPLLSQADYDNATERTFGTINAALPQLRWVALAMIFAMVIAIFVSGFLVKAHPVFIVPYILIVLLAIVFSVYISNAYEEILAGDLLGGTLQTFSATNFFMLNLPIFVTIVGVGGGIFLFIGAIVDRGQGGSLE